MKLRPSWKIILIFLLSFFSGSFQRKTSSEPNTLIQTRSGDIQGCLKDLGNDKKVKQFFGIPYAKPPVGELRWKAPEPVEPWSKTHDGCKLYPPRCPQQGMSVFVVEDRGPTNEDCLYLNVFTPASATPSSKLTVMLWIHGGGFIMGSGNDQDGSYLAVYNDVIVVTINYRLGVLGFMPFLGTSSKGNYGILDMIASLTWVKGNIESFGGNPDDVTIFGMSAGGAGISMLTMSPLGKGLFRRGISQSGVSLAPWAFGEIPNDKQIKDFSTVLGCTGDMHKILKCLREKTVEEILKTQKTLKQSGIIKPNVDGEILPDKPLELLKAGKINIHDEMVGATLDDGTLFVPPNIIYSKKVLEVTVEDSLPLDTESREVVKLAIVHEYSYHGENNNLKKWRKKISDFQTDDWNLVPPYRRADMLTKSGRNVFFYVFAHRNRNSLFPQWKGVPHGEDIAYVFGAPFNVSASGYRTCNDFTDMERGLSLAVMKMWSNFAKTGNPSIPDDGINWPQFTSENSEYLEIKMNPEVKGNIKPKIMAFWNDYIPKLKSTASGARNN